MCANAAKAITIYQVLELSRFIYQGLVMGPLEFDNPGKVEVHRARDLREALPPTQRADHN